MGALRTRMIEEMKLRNFSPRTQRSYLAPVMRIRHFGFLAIHLRNTPWADAANSSISIRCCRHLPFSQPRICCLRSSAAIFFAARAAVRER